MGPDAGTAKLLYTYGPFALLVLFLFVVEVRARGVLKDSSVPPKVSAAVYIATWAVIFMLCGTVVWIWWVLNISREATIYGTLSNIELSQEVGSHQTVFLRRSRLGERVDLDWRLVTTHPLPEGEKIDFVLTAGPNDFGQRYVFPIKTSYYLAPVSMRYVSRTKKLVLEHQGKTEELLPIDDDARVTHEGAAGSVAHATVGASLMPVLFAAQSPSQRVVQTGSAASAAARLDAADPITRRDARNELAARGKAAISEIQQILMASPRSSVRSRVGAISALNLMKGVSADDFSDEVRARIAQAASDPDPGLEDEAYRFFSTFGAAGHLDIEPATSDAWTMRVPAVHPSRTEFSFAWKRSSNGPIELTKISVATAAIENAKWTFVVLASQFDSNSPFTSGVASRRFTEIQRLPLPPLPRATARASMTNLSIPPGVRTYVHEKGLIIRVVGYGSKIPPG